MDQFIKTILKWVFVNYGNYFVDIHYFVWSLYPANLGPWMQRSL